MADQTLMDFFAGQRLTQVAQAAQVKRGIPRFLPAALYTASDSKPSSDQVEYISYTGHRAGAQLVSRMAPARAVTMPGSTRKYATALSVKEKWALPITFIDALKSSQPLIQANAQREFVKQMMDYNTRFETTRTNVVATAFALGKIYSDTSGNVLPSSSGAATAQTIDFSVPTANQFTKDGAGSTYNIGDWSNASTTIGKSLRALRDANLKANNYNLTTLLYGANVPDYLAANTTLTQYFARNAMFRDQIVQNNEIPDGTLGFNWKPVHSQYMLGATGTATSLFGDTFLAAMPDVSDDWYELVEGGSLIPNGIGTPNMNLDQMLSLVSVVNGKYAYGEMQTDPFSLNLIQGDSFVPIIKVPGTYYFGTCA